MNTPSVGQISPAPPRHLVGGSAVRVAETAAAEIAAEDSRSEGPRLRRLPGVRPGLAHAALIYNDAALPRPGDHGKGTHVDLFA